MFGFRKKRRPPIAGKSRRPSLLRRTANAIDEGIFFLAPTWGARRQATRRVRDLALAKVDRAIEKLGRGWDSESDERVRGRRWLSSRLSPDSLLEENLTDLQERASELYLKNGIAHSAIETRVTNEVGIGITPQPRVAEFSPEKNKKINDTMAVVIDRWSEDGVDVHREQTLGQFQRLLCRTFATFGEAFVLLGLQPHTGPIALALEIISPQRVETPPDKSADPTVRLGIQYDANNRKVGYWVRASHPGDEGFVSIRHQYYPRFENGQPRILHVWDELFAGQTRAFPWLAASQSRLKDLDDWHEAELVNKQVEACLGIVVQQAAGTPISPQDIAEGAASETTSTGKRLENIEPAMIHYAQPGEEVKVIDPSRPGGTFAPFIEAGLRSVASQANLPYELLSKNFARMNFSGGRLAMLDGRMAFRMRRQVLVEKALVPIYKRAVFEAFFNDEFGALVDLLEYIRRPHVYNRHKWQGQGWGYVDPQKEVGANTVAKDEGIATYSEIYAEKGSDWEEEFEQEEKERAKRIEMNVRLRALQAKLEKAAGLPPMEPPAEKSPANPQRPDDNEEREDDSDLQTEDQEYGDPVGAL